MPQWTCFFVPYATSFDATFADFYPYRFATRRDQPLSPLKLAIRVTADDLPFVGARN